MIYHPHVHFVVPGGTVSKDGTKWLSTPTNFLFPHGTVIKEYRDFFEVEMKRAELLGEISANVWQKKWVVDIKPVGDGPMVPELCRTGRTTDFQSVAFRGDRRTGSPSYLTILGPFGDGQAVLKYLAPYVHRVAISDNRIEHCDAQSVTYRWTPSGTKKSRQRTVTGLQFVQGFAQHVLPRQFQKVRHYGWMSSNSRFDIAKIRWIVWQWLGWTYWLGSGVAVPDRPPERRGPRCEHCDGELQLLVIVAADGRVLVNHGVAYLDSG